MLYDGAIKNLAKAQKAIGDNNFSQAHVQIIVAQDIILELMAVLNKEQKKCQNLSDLYKYLHNQMVEANIKKDCALLSDLEELMLKKRNVWQKATIGNIFEDIEDSSRDFCKTG